METEKRLIDLQGAIRHLRGKCAAKYPSTCMMGLFAAADELAKIPGEDAVEVVRCKDCAVPHNKWTGCPKLNGTIMPPDGFCSCGERKGND